MEQAKPEISQKVAQTLIMDEVFDLTLYQALRKRSTGEVAELLEALAKVETAHVNFWQEFFGQKATPLNLGQRLKLRLLLFVHTIFGERSVHIILESIEVHGITKYLKLWDHYEGTPLAESARKILEDELHHEDAILTASKEKQISGEKIRNIFLGFNDGLVEILGAVSGFFAAFTYPSSVIVAGLTVAVAGSISMAAGVYVSSGSEKEVEETERRREKFLGRRALAKASNESALTGATRVGIFYFIGSLVPLLPVMLGTTNVVASVISSAIMIILVSFVLSFLSGMNIRRRIVTNLVVIALAVTVTSGIGILARSWFGIVL